MSASQFLDPVVHLCLFFQRAGLKDASTRVRASDTRVTRLWGTCPTTNVSSTNTVNAETTDFTEESCKLLLCLHLIMSVSHRSVLSLKSKMFCVTDEEKENNRASKPHSTPATLEW